jgi:predicted secreted protein
VAALLALISCASPIPSSSQSPAPSDLLAFTAADSGRTINIKVGASFQVLLAGNGTTGYQWTASIDDPDVLQQPGDPAFRSANTSPGIVGSGGTYTFGIKAVRVGRSSLTFNYARSWEVGVAPVQVVRLTVVVV